VDAVHLAEAGDGHHVGVLERAAILASVKNMLRKSSLEASEGRRIFRARS
jgi:hypothetical protein